MAITSKRSKTFSSKTTQKKERKKQANTCFEYCLKLFEKLFANFSFFFSFFLKWLANFLGKQFTSGLSLSLSFSLSLPSLSVHSIEKSGNWITQFSESFFFSLTTFFRLKRTLHLTHGTLRAKQICCFFLIFQIVFELLFSFILTFKQNVLQHFYIFVQKQIFFGLSFGSNNFLTFLTRL